MCMITIFTPTYNRAYIIENLYHSLLKQTYKNFEWLIVDDGSTDDTKTKVEKWIEDDLITINYIYQENGGKHRAYNKGVNNAKGELFFTVDSDDYLPNNSLAIVAKQYEYIRDNQDFAGVCGCRFYPNGKRIGGELGFDVRECSQFELRYKDQVKGDMADVVRTEVLRKFPFPEIEGETFCTEAMIFDKIAAKYKIRYFNRNIYVCEYLPDGLTAKMTKVRMESPKTSTLYYAQLSRMPVPVLYRFKAYINYWRFCFCIDDSFLSKLKNISICSLFFYPIGLLMHLNDKKAIK